MVERVEVGVNAAELLRLLLRDFPEDEIQVVFETPDLAASVISDREVRGLKVIPIERARFRVTVERVSPA